MAKDKSKKKDKGEKGPVGDVFGKPSEAKGGGGDEYRFEHADNIGKLFLITPLRESKEKGYKEQLTDVIVADVVEINEKKPEKSVLHSEVWIFGGYSRGSLRSFIGNARVPARLGRDVDNKILKAQGEPWMLLDASSEDEQLCRDYLASVDPFKA